MGSPRVINAIFFPSASQSSRSIAPALCASSRASRSITIGISIESSSFFSISGTACTAMRNAAVSRTSFPGAATRSASFSTRTAFSVMSSGSPGPVPTPYKIPSAKISSLSAYKKRSSRTGKSAQRNKACDPQLFKNVRSHSIPSIQPDPRGPGCRISPASLYRRPAGFLACGSSRPCCLPGLPASDLN